MRTPDDILQTDRLWLRRYTRDDFELLWRLNRDERVMRYAGGVKTREGTETLLAERVLRYYDEHPGLGIWATFERASGEPVGMHLLNHMHGESYIQVGYLLYPEQWGKGYATEMARAVVDYGFAVCRLPQIVAITDRDNTASQHVLEKVGLRREGERRFAHPAYASGPLSWFVCDGSDWPPAR
jgi:RimJ/RimL family protein N-acetyltransferase